MRKIIYLSFLIITLAISRAKAQRDTITSYMRNVYVSYDITKGVQVSTKDSADFIRRVMSPDSAIDKNLFQVVDYYLNGKLKMMAMSTKGAFNVNLQGNYIEFYPNGHKKLICNYQDGHREGAVIESYPNGKVYLTGNYQHGRLKLVSCNDSTGNVLAENGKGKWLKFRADCKTLYEEGEVANGIENGDWKGYPNDSVYYVCRYINGEMISGITYDKKGNQYKFTSFEMLPEFKGGIEAFMNFIAKNLHYPSDARDSGIQGRVIITFVVERDGTLNDIKVIRGLSQSIDNESIRIIKLSPPWQPGIQNGAPVRVQYSVPIAFSLAGR